MDKAEVKSRLEALLWMREEEKTFLECIEQAKRIYIGVAGIDCSQQLPTQGSCQRKASAYAALYK